MAAYPVTIANGNLALWQNPQLLGNGCRPRSYRPRESVDDARALHDVDSLAKTIIEIIRAGRPGDEHGQARIRGRTNQQLFLPDLLLIGADDDDDEQVPQLRVPDSKAHEQCLAPQYSGHDA